MTPLTPCVRALTPARPSSVIGGERVVVRVRAGDVYSNRGFRVHESLNGSSFVAFRDERGGFAYGGF